MRRRQQRRNYYTQRPTTTTTTNATTTTRGRERRGKRKPPEAGREGPSPKTTRGSATRRWRQPRRRSRPRRKLRLTSSSTYTKETKTTTCDNEDDKCTSRGEAARLWRRSPFPHRKRVWVPGKTLASSALRSASWALRLVLVAPLSRAAITISPPSDQPGRLGGPEVMTVGIGVSPHRAQQGEGDLAHLVHGWDPSGGGL